MYAAVLYVIMLQIDIGFVYVYRTRTELYGLISPIRGLLDSVDLEGEYTGEVITNISQPIWKKSQRDLYNSRFLMATFCVQSLMGKLYIVGNAELLKLKRLLGSSYKQLLKVPLSGNFWCLVKPANNFSCDLRSFRKQVFNETIPKLKAWLRVFDRNTRSNDVKRGIRIPTTVQVYYYLFMCISNQHIVCCSHLSFLLVTLSNLKGFLPDSLAPTASCTLCKKIRIHMIRI
jgi:hypothetical protein